MSADPLNPTGNPHYIARYQVGGDTQRLNTTYKGGARKATPAAKCRCGWQGVGEEAIREHQTIAGSWLPPTARATDPATSHLAAAPTRRKASNRVRLLAAYAAAGDRGLTDEEAADATGIVNGAWKRCSDLRALGLIAPLAADDGVATRRSREGREQRVCGITQQGRDYLKGLERR